MPEDDWRALDEREAQFFYLNWIYMLTAYIAIVLILRAGFTGIILTSFSQLREQNVQIEMDMAQKCFVCGLDRSDFERAGAGFLHHTQQDHNIWNYVLFMIYIQRKDPSKFTGTETALKSKIEAGEIDW